MAKRTFEYTVTGTLTVDETDLRTAVAGIPVLGEEGEEFETAMMMLDHARLETPDRLVEQQLYSWAVRFRSVLPVGEHSNPKVRVVQRAD